MSKETSLKEIYSNSNVIYGLTNGAGNLRSSMTSSYRMFFLTSVLMINAATAGNIASIGPFVAMIMTFVWGIIIQKSNPKMGRIRFWMLIGGIATALFLTLCFSNFGFEGSAKTIYYIIAVIGMDVSYILFNIVYSSCSNLLAKTTQERANMQSARIVINSITKVLFGLVNVSMIAYFGKILNNKSSGYSVFAGIIAVLFLIATLAMVNLLKGKDLSALSEKETTEKKDSVPIATILKMVSKKETIFTLLGTLFGTCISYMMLMGGAVYYYAYIAKDMSGFTWFFSVSSFITIFSGALVPYITKKIGLNGTILWLWFTYCGSFICILY